MERFTRTTNRRHHLPTTTSPWVPTRESRRKSQDPRSHSQLTSTSVKSTEKSWKNSIRNGRRMKLWSMSAPNGLTWTRNRKSPTMKWLLWIRHAMINSWWSSLKPRTQVARPQSGNGSIPTPTSIQTSKVPRTRTMNLSRWLRSNQREQLILTWIHKRKSRSNHKWCTKSFTKWRNNTYPVR